MKYPNIEAERARYGLNQTEFANALNIKIGREVKLKFHVPVLWL